VEVVASSVIYGHSTGLPQDATISSVTFAREGDNLVTTFQVQGLITNAYGYTIGIKAKNSNNQYSDYIIAYSYSLLGTGANFYDGITNTTTHIVDSTVSGSIWTASVPLSWIDGLTDFLAVTTVVQTVSWGIRLVDSAPSPFSPGHVQFVEVNLPPSIGATTSKTTTQTYTTSMPSLQMPQPPQSTGSQSTSNTLQLVLVIAVIAAAVLVFLFIRLKRGKKPKATKAEKVDSKTKKAASGKAFCVNCGKELPADWKFCRHCGTKQP